MNTIEFSAVFLLDKTHFSFFPMEQSDISSLYAWI